MKEVKDLASVIQEAVASIKQTTVNVRDDFLTEIERARDNSAKIKSLTQGLKDANKDMESILVDQNSNFQPDTKLSTDKNGVTLNKEGVK